MYPGDLRGAPKPRLFVLPATRSPLAPNARGIVIGYPRLFNGEECNLGARISSGEQGDLNSVADVLATKISGVTAAHGFDFIDTREPFNPHRIATTSSG